MGTSRRDFVKWAAASGALGLTTPAAGSALPSPASRRPGPPLPPAPAPLRILILGGTGFTGPHQVRYAVERGHHVTVFNRGRRDTELPAAVEQLRGDRNTGELDALRGQTWDVVIDNPTTLPFWVRDAAAILKDATKQYVFISTISVYEDNTRPGMDETATLAEYDGPDAMKETQDSVRARGELYGQLKVQSEREVLKWFPDRATIIRPGLIVGPRDPTDRFTYWPLRVDRGGEVLAPGTPDDPTQFIDARDLAQWTIRMVEQSDTGIYNATGPESPLTMAGLLYGLRAVTTGPIDFTWVPQEFLAQHDVHGWSDMPVWVPRREDNGGFLRVSIARALAKGLTFRPLATTATDTLAWFRTLPAERQARLLTGIAPDRETQVLAAWHQSQR